MLLNILDRTLEIEGSDLHLTSGLRPVVRVAGELKELDDMDKMTDKVLYKIKEDLYKKYKRDNDFTISYSKHRFRINIYKQMGSYAFAIRILPMKIASIEDLGLPEVVSSFSNYRNGIILISGTTGSGKSTSLAAIIESINLREKKHILTLEDPIEYIYESKESIISQREVGVDVNSYEEGIKSSLRQDVDLIMIGELRDLPSIRNALRLAETGHLVLSTLHTKSAFELINRIIDLFPAYEKDFVRGQLANSLRAVLCQELIRGNNARIIALCEIMIVDRAIRNIINEDKKLSALEDQIYMGSANSGSQTRDQGLVKLVREEKISLEKASLLSNNPDNFKRLLIYR